MSESTYRWFSAVAGAVAGAVCVVGFVGLAYRRATNARVRRTTSRTDLLVYLLLVVLIVLGCWMTFAHNLITSSPYDYRESVSEWWRSLFILQPDVEPVANANTVYQVHAIVAWGVLGAVPVQPPGPRLEHPAAVPGAAVHPLPAPLPGARAMTRAAGGPAHAGHRRVRGVLLRVGADRAPRPGPAGVHRPVGLRDLRDRRRARTAGLDHADPARLAHRPARRPARVHRAHDLHAAAADRARALPRHAGRRAALRAPARVRGRLVRRRGAVRQRLVPAGASGLRPRDLRGGDGGNRARRPDGAEHRRRVGPVGPVLGGRRRRGDRRARSSGCSPATPRARAAAARPRGCSRHCRSSGAADAPGR